MKKPIRSLADYLILTIIVSIAVLLVLFYNGNKNYQEYIIVGLSALYVLWGIFHHAREKTLETKIVLEYFLFAILGSVLVTGLLK